MQKFKKILVALCLLVSLCFCFVGCDDQSSNDTFYIQTNTKLSTFITDVCLNNNYRNGIVYGENVSLVLSKIEDQTFNNENNSRYTELLDVYDSIFVASFYFLSSFDGVLLTLPNEVTDEMKQDYLDFENQIDDVTNSINNFSTNVHELDIRIDTTSEQTAFGSISLQKLREYKRELIDLCQKIVELDNMFISICENYIYTSFDTFKDENGNYITLTDAQLKNQKNLANLKSVIATITPAIEYLNAFDGDYISLSTDKFFQTLNQYTSLDYSKEGTTTVEELDKFLRIYNMYQNDQQIFSTSLSQINFREFMRANFDPSTYAKDDATLYAYATKVLSFTNYSVENLYNINKILCE